jgi:hypothetical protein
VQEVAQQQLYWQQRQRLSPAAELHLEVEVEAEAKARARVRVAALSTRAEVAVVEEEAQGHQILSLISMQMMVAMMVTKMAWMTRAIMTM